MQPVKVQVASVAPKTARAARPAGEAQGAQPLRGQPPEPIGAGAAESGSKPQANPADEIVARVEAFYDGVRTFRATFKQRYGFGSGGSGSTGTVTFEQPDKMSWRYGNGNRVVSDGQWVKVYERVDQRLYELPREKTQYPAALAFLTTQGDFKTSFELRKVDSGPSSPAAALTIEAAPRFATTAYERLVFYVDARTFEVQRVLLSDAQGNRSRYDFSGVELNAPVAVGEFEFTAPAGTETIRL